MLVLFVSDFLLRVCCCCACCGCVVCFCCWVLLKMLLLSVVFFFGYCCVCGLFVFVVVYIGVPTVFASLVVGCMLV